MHHLWIEYSAQAHSKPGAKRPPTPSPEHPRGPFASPVERTSVERLASVHSSAPLPYHFQRDSSHKSNTIYPCFVQSIYLRQDSRIPNPSRLSISDSGIEHLRSYESKKEPTAGQRRRKTRGEDYGHRNKNFSILRRRSFSWGSPSHEPNNAQER